jgi:hypothetical protein
MVSDIPSERVNWHQDFANSRSNVRCGDCEKPVCEWGFENDFIKAEKDMQSSNPRASGRMVRNLGLGDRTLMVTKKLKATEQN